MDVSQELVRAWKILSKIQYAVVSHVENMPPHRMKRGVLRVQRKMSMDEHILHITERGTWIDSNTGNIEFFDRYRWTLNRQQGVIRLEHLRYGVENPVFLCNFFPISSGYFRSETPHICRLDVYSALFTFNQSSLFLKWSIKGKNKNYYLFKEYALN